MIANALKRRLGKDRWTNWAGNQQCRPVALEQPTTEQEIVDLVGRARQQGTALKVVGAGHSWSDIACTDGIQVNLDQHSRVLAVDTSSDDGQGPQIRVCAGIRLKDLNQALAASGLGMPVLGSVSEQSVAGAISTGTHGSGARYGNLSTAVASMRLAAGNGKLLELGPDTPELFSAARVGLGCLGIITEVTLDVEPAFNLAEETWVESFDDAVARIDELAAAHQHFKLWWLPHTDKVGVYVANRTQQPVTPRTLQRRLDESAVTNGLFTFLLKVGLVRPAAIPWINRLVAGSHFRQDQRVARAVEVFNVPQIPIHREVEYAVHMERSAAALYGLRDMIRRKKHRVNFIVEARFVAADDIMMSPAFGRPSCQIGAYMAEVAHIKDYFIDFERLMLALGGRPHWGKEFSMGGDALRAVVPNLDRFDDIRRELDPDGIFENDFTRRLFG